LIKYIEHFYVIGGYVPYLETAHEIKERDSFFYQCSRSRAYLDKTTSRLRITIDFYKIKETNNNFHSRRAMNVKK